MALSDFFDTRFEDLFYNPNFISIIWTLLIFLLVFTFLSRMRLFRENKSSTSVIAIVISLIFFYYFRELTVGIDLFAITLVILSISIIYLLFRPFFRSLRGQY